jgi:hypothetical protein
MTWSKVRLEATGFDRLARGNIDEEFVKEEKENEGVAEDAEDEDEEADEDDGDGDVDDVDVDVDVDDDDADNNADDEIGVLKGEDDRSWDAN